jgi:hypothetical protein
MIFKLGEKKKKGVKAILVYPMNALINSQEEEIKGYQENYGDHFPVKFAKYTGQEKGDVRAAIENDQPDIILTNYMMLELIMTRSSEKWLRDWIKENLQFLIFDELHTYRGRQGADVSMLIRRIKVHCDQKLICIGTSATMASEGTPEAKKIAVAEVVGKIFGEDFETRQIIDESLKPCTLGLIPNPLELRQSALKGINQLDDESSFINHPLSCWLEMQIALKNNSGKLERGRPLSISQIANQLKLATEIEFQIAYKVVKDLLQWAEKLNEQNRLDKSGRSFLPFRFHQFISQTSTVSVTLESRQNRKITIQPGRYIKEDAAEKLLYPLLFSRYSGVDFICVEKDTEKGFLLPRNPEDPIITHTQKELTGQNLNEHNLRFGYIILDEGEEFWNEDISAFAPDAWFNTSGSTLRPYYDWHMPRPIYFNSGGRYSNAPDYPLKGYYLPAKLRVDPTAGVFYEDVKTNENTKLMSLGHEGRSTATTVLSYSIIESLLYQHEEIRNQKLLSFTDNRQDAALQAGHFKVSSTKINFD